MLRKSFKIAKVALGKNRLRTGLAMLGMTIGVSAVLTMVALGTGAQENVSSQVRSAGTTLLFVRAGNFTRGGEELKIASGLGSATTLTPDDAAAIQALPGVAHTSSLVRARSWISHGSDRQFGEIYGVDVDYPKMYDWTFEKGKFFKNSAVRDGEKVAVIGSALRDLLFPDQNPVGEQIEIHGTPFTVKGWFSTNDEAQSGMAIVPYTALEELTHASSLSQITVAAGQAGDASEIARQIVPLQRRRGRSRCVRGQGLCRSR